MCDNLPWVEARFIRYDAHDVIMKADGRVSRFYWMVTYLKAVRCYPDWAAFRRMDARLCGDDRLVRCLTPTSAGSTSA